MSAKVIRLFQNDARTYKLVAVDETHLFGEHIAKEAGKLFGLYAYDASHVADSIDSGDVMPCRELWYIRTVTKNEVSDNVCRELCGREVWVDPFTYMQVSQVQELEHIDSYEIDPKFYDKHAPYQENMEAAVEHFQFRYDDANCRAFRARYANS
jgi:hypothetical protein